MSLLALLTFLACTDDVVTLVGRVGDGPGLEAPGLAGAEVEFVEREPDERLTVVSTDSDGFFEVTLPVGLEIAAVVRSPETVVTSFVGSTGFVDVSIEDGTLYGLAPETLAEWRNDYVGCPGADASVVVLGQMVFVNLAGDQGGENPIAAGGRAQIVTADDELLACYLDPKQGVFSPTADRTGDTGRFAIFDVPSGTSVLDVVFEFAPDSFDSPGPIPVYVPDVSEEVVVPYLPLRLTFPI